eukprot:scpid96313/ scgid2121/ 
MQLTLVHVLRYSTARNYTRTRYCSRKMIGFSPVIQPPQRMDPLRFVVEHINTPVDVHWERYHFTMRSTQHSWRLVPGEWLLSSDAGHLEASWRANFDPRK